MSNNFTKAKIKSGNSVKVQSQLSAVFAGLNPFSLSLESRVFCI